MCTKLNASSRWLGPHYRCLLCRGHTPGSEIKPLMHKENVLIFYYKPGEINALKHHCFLWVLNGQLQLNTSTIHLQVSEEYFLQAAWFTSWCQSKQICWILLVTNFCSGKIITEQNIRKKKYNPINLVWHAHINMPKIPAEQHTKMSNCWMHRPGKALIPL